MTTDIAPYVANLLSCVFANDVALSDEGIASAMGDPSMQKGALYGDALRRELVELYSNANTDWLALLDNDDYEVSVMASQEEARAFVTKNIWNVLFPEQKGDPPKPHGDPD